MKRKKLNLSKSSYTRIREAALNSYKTAVVTSDLTDVFLSACWTSAVIIELQKLGLMEEIDWTSIDLKQNINVESDDE